MTALRLPFTLCLGLLTTTVLAEDPPAEPAPIVVDASEHDSLQAAFDALPATGGMVKLPPGTTEITEPLIISTPGATGGLSTSARAGVEPLAFYSPSTGWYAFGSP